MWRRSCCLTTYAFVDLVKEPPTDHSVMCTDPIEEGRATPCHCSSITGPSDVVCYNQEVYRVLSKGEGDCFWLAWAHLLGSPTSARETVADWLCCNDHPADRKSEALRTGALTTEWHVARRACSTSQSKDGIRAPNGPGTDSRAPPLCRVSAEILNQSFHLFSVVSLLLRAQLLEAGAG